MTSRLILAFLIAILFSCGSSEPAPSVIYYPPINGTWETSTLASLGWNESALPDLRTFMVSTNTRAIIVLKNGKIAIEEYRGTQLASANPFTAASNWYWASAGKTLTSCLVGIAHASGKVGLDEKSSTYLGKGWTSLTADQEDRITVRHQLTMTTGLNDGVADPDCTTKACLVYKADPGTRWAYHNAPYTLLDGVISNSTKQTLTNYFLVEIGNRIGMDGAYDKSGYNNVFYSTPRSMAKFGLLLLNKGVWNGISVIPEAYFNLMIKPSQALNNSYGYLTWLNGKSSFMVPGSQIVIPGSLSPNAPSDMFAAMGKNGQLINVVPSQNIVVIRVGDAPDNSLVPFTVQDDLWVKLNAIIKD